MKQYRETGFPVTIVRPSHSGYTAKARQSDRIMSASVAATLQEMMHYNVVYNYGESNFPDLYVCAKTGTAEVGGGLEPNATFAVFLYFCVRMR